MSAARNRVRSAFCRGNGQIADDIFWFHNWILLPVTVGISLAGAGADRLYRLALQRDRQSSAFAAHAQWLLEFAWTVTPALTPGGHRGAVVPAAGGAAHHPRARPDAEGDGLAVALELRLSEIRGRLFVRFAVMSSDKDLKPGQPRVITADNPMVVPDRQGDRSRRDLAGRHSLVLGAVVRRQDRRHPGPAQQDLVQGRPARASFTGNARTSAASTTRSCRSTSASSASRTTRLGSFRRRNSSRSPTASMSRRRRSSIPKSAPSARRRS